MPNANYLALLRGINVGGNNIIKMTDLKACLEKLDLDDVTTFIQSGNVVFSTSQKNTITLTKDIEQALSKRFGYESKIVLVSYKQLQETVQKAPPKFGTEPEKYRYDVLFLRPETTAKDVVKVISLKEGVDAVRAGKQVVYFSRLTARATQSHLSKIVKQPVYKQMTIRNWNSTTKLLKLMEEKGGH